MIRNQIFLALTLTALVCVNAEADTEIGGSADNDKQDPSPTIAAPVSDPQLPPGFPLPPGVPQPPGGATPFPLPGNSPPGTAIPFDPQPDAPPVFPIGVPQNPSPFGNEFATPGIDAEQLRRQMEAEVLSQQGSAQTPCCQNIGGANEDYKLQRQITNLQNYLQRQQQTMGPFPLRSSDE